jgi:hypothetical protein
LGLVLYHVGKERASRESYMRELGALPLSSVASLQPRSRVTGLDHTPDGATRFNSSKQFNTTLICVAAPPALHTTAGRLVKERRQGLLRLWHCSMGLSSIGTSASIAAKAPDQDVWGWRGWVV